MNSANINAVDKNGWSTLMFAASQGEADIVRILMSRGADPNLKSKEGETALMIATSEQHKETAGVLREARIAAGRK